MFVSLHIQTEFKSYQASIFEMSSRESISAIFLFNEKNGAERRLQTGMEKGPCLSFSSSMQHGIRIEQIPPASLSPFLVLSTLAKLSLLQVTAVGSQT